ncbi:MAG: RNHCP domain-containing protein [Ktedonobacterales bacterium]
MERGNRQVKSGKSVQSRSASHGAEETPSYPRLRRAARRDQPAGRRRLPLEELGDYRRSYQPERGFKCGHCKQFIGSLPSGGHHRNHCPACLYSRHVDGEHSGDRTSSCRALMEPIGAFVRPSGEHVLVHRCLGCGFERFNRIAADDNFELVLSLPELPPRSARPT